jgi:hypothetical protein
MPCRSASSLRMGKAILLVVACALFGAARLAAQEEQVFKGQIGQCACTGPDAHAAATDKGATPPPCPFTCAKAGARYLLFDTKNKIAYQIDKPDYGRAYLALNVFVIGMLDKATGIIHVHNVIPDLPPKIKTAKSVAIVCDACPRAMAKAKKAAFEEVTDWKRFTVVSEPRSADLIFLFSANRYLGDFLTRDGPDQRLVNVETAYMDVVDPHTGKSLWGDSERVGSWFVGSATKDLIDELRELMEADVNPAERKAFIARNHIPKVSTDTGK